MNRPRDPVVPEGGLVRFVPVDRLHGRRTAKWTLYPADVLPMPVAEMDVLPAEPVRRVLVEAVERGELGYPPMDGSYQHAFTEFAAKRWGWSPDPAHVFAATDVGVAMTDLLRKLAPPGPVVVSTPVYDGFFQWPRTTGRQLIDVPLLRDPPAEGRAESYRLDVAGIEQAFARGATAYLLCNPHNPAGLVPPKQDLAALADAAHRFGAVIISDEVHAPLVFGDGFVPFTSSSPRAAEVGASVHAASKAWNLAGLKCALAVVEDDRLRSRLEGCSEAGRWAVGTLGALAATAAYREGGPWLDELRGILQDRQRQFAKALATELPGARCAQMDFGFLAWVDTSALGWPGEASDVALRHGRLALGIGSAFGKGWDKYVRVNLGTCEELVAQAVGALAGADRAVRAGR